jgi:hypothetical protein
MFDLALGVVVVVVVSALALWIGARISRRAPRTALFLAAATLAALLWFAMVVHGRLLLARWIPASNVIVLGNAIPVGAALLGGIVLGQRATAAWRRLLVAAVLVGLGFSTVAQPFFAGSAAIQGPKFRYGAGVQSDPASCSACCAAELLRQHHIPATERELARLCLTSQRGTPELGLYRGLKLKTWATSWDVAVLRGGEAELRRPESWPALLLVDAEPPAIGGESPGTRWHQSVNHAVILQGFADNRLVAVIDPVTGPTTWSEEEFLGRWHGAGLRLVRRQ